MVIKKIHIVNFKRFKDFSFTPNECKNIIVGDNETGKSTVLEAIDLVSNGSIKRVEAVGLEKLFNVYAIKDFLNSDREFTKLPKMIIELYLNDTGDFHFNGKNNTSKEMCDGLRLVCEPDIDFSDEIKSVLSETSNNCFPFEFYKIKFSTFADSTISEYGGRKIKTLFIDNSGNSYNSFNDFVKRKYRLLLEDRQKDKIILKSNYELMRDKFENNCFSSLNKEIAEPGIKIGLKTNTMNDFESNLMIFDNDIAIDSKGTGTQMIIKTSLALDSKSEKKSIILLEEPENHLSNTNLEKLLSLLERGTSEQLFITTHNNTISAKLDLKNVQILNLDNDKVLSLSSLSEETASYFMKTPPAGILDFVLSNKVILVEGPSEMILFDKFYESVTKGKRPSDYNVKIIDVRGLSFKRYLEVGKIINKKLAIITDNDGQSENEINQRYFSSTYDNSKVFFGSSIRLPTFEYHIYESNKELCDSLFGNVSTLEYMLKNKTESALQLVSSKNSIIVPEHIKKAIEWINV